MWADPLGFRQIHELLTSGQVAIIAALGSWLTGLSPAWTLGLGVSGVQKLMGAVVAGLLLGAASKTFGLQLANLTAELFVFLCQRRDPPHAIGVSALPIPGLLPQLQIFTPQSGDFGAQLIHFRQEPHNQRSQICIRPDRLQRFKQHAIHDRCVVPSPHPARLDELVLKWLARTGSAVVYRRRTVSPSASVGSGPSQNPRPAPRRTDTRPDSATEAD